MDKKRKRGYYIKSAKGKKSKPNHNLEADMRGFFITCNNAESQAVREAYSILNEYADELYGPEQTCVSSDESECEDIEAAVNKQVEQIKQQNKSTQRRFQSVNTGAKNCVFVKTSLEKPTEITDLLFKKLLESKKSVSRYVMKLIPVVATCRADADKLGNFALDQIDAHLKGVTEFTYGVDIKIRNNAGLKKDTVMKAVTQALTDLKPAARVQLTDPDYLFSVNVIGRILCFSILKDHTLYRKYNLQQLCAVPEQKEAKTDATNSKPETENGGKNSDSVDINVEKDTTDKADKQLETDDSLKEKSTKNEVIVPEAEITELTKPTPVNE